MKKLFIIIFTFGFISCVSARNLYAPLPYTTYVPAVYVGIQAGYAQTNWHNLQYYELYKRVTVSNTVGTRIFLGYDCFQNFSFEVGYSQFFNPTVVYADIPDKGKIEYIARRFKNTYSIDVSGKFRLHIIDSFGAYIQLGVDYINVKNNTVPSAYNLLLGVGATYNIARNIVLNFSWMKYNGDPKWNTQHIPYLDFYSLGISYKFDLI